MTKPVPAPQHGAGTGLELSQKVQVDGIPIRYAVEGPSGAPTLLLIHGSGANHLWWDPMLPYLISRWRVVRLDLSGHGESGRRESYGLADFAREVVAVLSNLGTGPVLLVGHSMWGKVALAAAGMLPAVVGVMLFDTAVRPVNQDRPWSAARQRSRPFYATKAEIMNRFRLVPDQPPPDAAIMEMLAAGSVRREVRGWTWKHDGSVTSLVSDADVSNAAAGVNVPVCLAYATLSSLVTASILEYMVTGLGPQVTGLAVEDVHHHLVLERPELCVKLLEEFADSLEAV